MREVVEWCIHSPFGAFLILWLVDSGASFIRLAPSNSLPVLVVALAAWLRFASAREAAILEEHLVVTKSR
jgi:hypothetical protein